jgi:methylase of polypeptide subunit release factors
MTRAHEPDSFELNDEQIRELIKLAKFTEKDVFYDRGSGEGRVVIQVAKLTKVKKSIGIEAYRKPYKIARENANNQLTLEQLRRVDFWFGEMKSEPMEDDYDSDYFYDISDATVIYNSLHEELDDLDYYKDMLKKRGLE